MIVPGLGDKTGSFGLGLQDGLKAGIIGSGTARALGHAKGRERGLRLAGFGEERGIRGVTTCIAAFDVVHTEAVQHVNDDKLVIQREVHAWCLLAVAQCRIKKIKAFAGHHSNPL